MIYYYVSIEDKPIIKIKFNKIIKDPNLCQRAIHVINFLINDKTPCIVILENFDSLKYEESYQIFDHHSLLNHLRKEIFIVTLILSVNNVHKIFLTTTNPWKLDNRVIKRFQKRIYIELPDEKLRLAMCEDFLNKNPHNITQTDIKEIVDSLDGYLCSEIVGILNFAHMELLNIKLKDETAIITKVSIIINIGNS